MGSHRRTIFKVRCSVGQVVEVTTTTEALSSLIQRVEEGVEIVLTREGRPVARLTSAGGEATSEQKPQQQARAKEATESIRARAERLHLSPFNMDEFKRDRDEGRL